MVRNLAAQIEAIWPPEQPIFARHPPPSRILEVGCGIGESIFKLAQLYPKAAFTGVDLEESHLERACAIRAVAMGGPVAGRPSCSRISFTTFAR